MINLQEIPVVYIGLFNAGILVSMFIFGAMGYARLSARINANAVDGGHLLQLVKLHGQITDSQAVQTQGMMDTLKPAVKVLEKQAEVIKRIVTNTNDIVVEDRPKNV